MTKDPMLILGIDPSLSSTGLCLINERGTLITHTALCHSLEDPKRLYYISGVLSTFLHSYDPTHIIYERQVPQMRYNYSAGSMIPLAELAGVLKLVLLDYVQIKKPNVSVYRVPPEVIKESATSKSKATKEEMIAALPEKIRKKFEESVSPDSVDDVSDAYHAANLLRRSLQDESKSEAFSKYLYL